MQMFIRSFAVFAVLCSAPAAFGSIIIDTFQSPVVLGPNTKVGGDTSYWTTRTGSTGTIDPATISGATLPTFHYPNKPTPSYVELVYAIPTLTGPQVFSFNYSVTSGAGANNQTETVTITLNGIDQSFNMARNTTQAGSYSQTLNGSISSVTLRVAYNTTSNTSPGATFSFTSSFTAVPEPATMTLLGLTGIAGVIAHRRRRKAQLVA